MEGSATALVDGPGATQSTEAHDKAPPVRRHRSPAGGRPAPSPGPSVPAPERLPKRPPAYRRTTNIVPPAPPPEMSRTPPATPAPVAGVPAETPAAAEAGPQAPNLIDPAVVVAMNQHAAVVRNVLFPTQARHALLLDGKLGLDGMRLFLAQFHQDAGEAGDPIETLLLDQLILAHFKIGLLHGQAEDANQLEFAKLYTNAAARLLSELCKTVETLIAYRASLRDRHKKRAKPESRQDRPKMGTRHSQGSLPAPGKKKTGQRTAK